MTCGGGVETEQEPPKSALPFLILHSSFCILHSPPPPPPPHHDFAAHPLSATGYDRPREVTRVLPRSLRPAVPATRGPAPRRRPGLGRLAGPAGRGPPGVP